MDAEPFVVEGVPDKVRCMAWHQDDTLLLTSYIDKPGIGQVLLLALLPLGLNAFYD